jgi:hypothetical protein
MPEGTLSARQARGRVLLAKRLARHGLVVSGADLAWAPSQGASAYVPTSVISSTIKAATALAAGPAAATGDHRAVPPHQGGNSRLVTTADEFLQQLRIGQPRPSAREHHSTKMPDDLAHLVPCRVVASLPATLALYPYCCPLAAV